MARGEARGGKEQRTPAAAAEGRKDARARPPLRRRHRRRLRVRPRALERLGARDVRRLVRANGEELVELRAGARLLLAADGPRRQRIARVLRAAAREPDEAAGHHEPAADGDELLRPAGGGRRRVPAAGAEQLRHLWNRGEPDRARAGPSGRLRGSACAAHALNATGLSRPLYHCGRSTFKEQSVGRARRKGA